MITKLYETIKKYIKKEYKFIISLIIILSIFTIKLPFYIDIPGGIINISDRIIIDNKTNLEGTLNLAYVSEMRATIPTLIISKINNNWDTIKLNEVLSNNETEEDLKFREKIELQEAISNALYAGFKEANEEFTTENNKIYITSIFKDAKTDLKIGDQIIKIDDIEIKQKEDLKIIQEKLEKDKIKIEVKNNNKTYIRTAELIKIEDKILIGVGIGETFEIKSNHKIDTSYKNKEYGPSGGMMMALTIYNNLLNQDITKGKIIVGTGTIDKNGNVGEIGGVKYKLIGAVKNNADIFIVPSGENYEEALKIKQEKNYDIKIIEAKTLNQVIEELNKI